MTSLGRLALALLLVACLAPASAHAQKRFMIIGDSIQAGTGLHDTTALASYRLQTLANVVVHNFASPGARLTNVGFLPGMRNAGPSVGLVYGFFGMHGLVINLGTNDWGGGADLGTFVTAYQALLDAIPPPLKVTCMGPTWSTSEGQVNSVGLTKDAYRYGAYAACLSRGKPYIEGKSAIPNSAAYFVDGVHPNELGHRAMGDFLKAQLTQLGWIP